MTARRRPQAMETRIQRKINRARRPDNLIRLQARLRPHRRLPRHQCALHYRRLAADRPAGHRQLRLPSLLLRALDPLPLRPQYDRLCPEPQVNSWCRLPRYRTMTMPECW